MFNSRLEHLKTDGGKNDSLALNEVEEKVKDMMQLSVEGMPSHFDCDIEVDAMPSVYDVANEVYGKTMFNISCICLQPQIYLY